MGTIELGKNANRLLLYLSLLLIWTGSVVSSRFDSWGFIVGGAAIAVLGCYLNQRSVKWVTGSETKEGEIIIKTSEVK